MIFESLTHNQKASFAALISFVAYRIFGVPAIDLSGQVKQISAEQVRFVVFQNLLQNLLQNVNLLDEQNFFGVETV